MNPGFVGERVTAHDRLVRLDLVAGKTCDHPARSGDLGRLDAAPKPVGRLACAQQHHDLLQRGVARPLADAVDRAFDLATPLLQAGQRVGHREPEVVVAVDRGRDLGQPGHQPVELAPHGGVLVGHRVADRVGHIDRRRALVERDLQHLGGELELRPGGVHRRELDVVAVLLGVRDRGAGLSLHVVAGGLQLILDVDVARRDEGVYARALGVLDRVPGGVDVLEAGAREPADDRSVHLASYGLDGFEVARRGDREAGLDDVHAQARELLGDLQLLLLVERDPGRLLAVAQRRVEDLYSPRFAPALGGVLGHVVPFSAPPRSPLVSRLRGRHALFPPKGEEEKSKRELERHRATHSTE